MKETNLMKELQRLCHGSQETVQSGSALSPMDQYLHVERLIESDIRIKMDEISEQGGGLLLLVGSAGDGKSHIISNLKASGKYADFEFLNDATEGCSPSMNAVKTLKYTLQNFSDERIEHTTDKILVAINLGKLLDFVEDSEIKSRYTTFCNVAQSLAEGDQQTIHKTNKIKIISLSHQQIFELDTETSDNTYPVSSRFLSCILSKIASKSENNPFYQAFLEDKVKGQNAIDPVAINYELLQVTEIQNTIVKLLIEAIIRFNLLVTPREFLDFVYSILVYPSWKTYRESKDFFSALLPTMLLNGGENKIQRAISLLDPIKCSCLSHDNNLAVLYSTFDFNPQILQEALGPKLIEELSIILKKFYANKDVNSRTQLATLLFRLNHLFSYHSDSQAYKKFLKYLKGYYLKDGKAFHYLNHLVLNAIPRHYGSYIDKPNFIPLNIQGSHYKLFATLKMPSAKYDVHFNANKPHIFDIAMNLNWTLEGNKIPLHIDYPLFEHLIELKNGKLATTYEGEKSLAFSNFVRELSQYSEAKEEVLILNDKNEIITFSETYGNIQMA